MKGYWLILGTEITDPDAQAEYVRLWAPIAERYGARIIRGDAAPELKEAGDKSRVLLVEFASLSEAKADYSSRRSSTVPRLDRLLANRTATATDRTTMNTTPTR